MKNTNWIEPEKTTASYAWRRWLARQYDLLLAAFVIVFVIILGAIMTKYDGPLNILMSNANLVALLYALLGSLLAILLNAALIAFFGNTLGKWLCGIKILNKEGYGLNFQEAFKREMLVYVKGLGLGIFIIQLFTQYKGYKSLIKHNITTWDKKMCFKATYRRQSLLITLFISLFMLPTLFILFIGLLVGGYLYYKIRLLQ